MFQTIGYFHGDRLRLRVRGETAPRRIQDDLHSSGEAGTSLAATDNAAHWQEVVSGLYVVHLEIECSAPAQIGKLGEFTFPAGHYLYVGSAMNSLWPRVRRHLDGRGPRHWHIDHLRDVASPAGAWVAVTGEKRECEFAEAMAGLPGVEVWPPRFGASDCNCPGHLLRLPGAPDQMALLQAAESVELKLASMLAG